MKFNYDDYEFKDTKQATWISKFLWWSAGADQQLLSKCTYSDRVKFASLGGVVFATGIMAFVSMTFAVYIILAAKVTIEKDGVEIVTSNMPVLWAAIAGFTWGLIIFNLDRFIVSSTGKGDGKDTISLKEFTNSIPRLLMALVIGLTISAPLEVYMFKPEIIKQFYQLNKDKVKEDGKKVEEAFKPDIDRVDADLKKMEAEKADKYSTWKTMDEQVSYEITHGGCHDKCLEQKARRDAMDKEIKALEKRIDAKQKEKDEKVAEKQEELAELDKKLMKFPGLLECITTLEEVPGSFWPIWLIRFLFMVIEMSPIIFKLMLVKGTYDYLEDNKKEIMKARYGIKVESEFKKDANNKETEVQLITYHVADQLLYEKIKLLEAQKELSDKIIGKWKEKKAEDIDQNTDKYIETEEDKK